MYMSSESFDVEWWNKKYLNELSLLYKCILLNDLLLIKMNLVVWIPASSDVRNLNYQFNLIIFLSLENHLQLWVKISEMKKMVNINILHYIAVE